MGTYDQLFYNMDANADLKSLIMSKHHLLENFWLLMDNASRYTDLQQPSSTVWCQKSASEATRLMKLGNEAYRSKQFEDALKFYSQSVANAPIDSRVQALAYGSRSAVLLRCKKFEPCLLDVNRALGGLYPQNRKEELLNRKEICWEQLQAKNEFKMKRTVRIFSITGICSIWQICV